MISISFGRVGTEAVVGVLAGIGAAAVVRPDTPEGIAVLIVVTTLVVVVLLRSLAWLVGGKKKSDRTPSPTRSRSRRSARACRDSDVEATHSNEP